MAQITIYQNGRRITIGGHRRRRGKGNGGGGGGRGHPAKQCYFVRVSNIVCIAISIGPSLTIIKCGEMGHIKYKCPKFKALGPNTGGGSDGRPRSTSNREDKEDKGEESNKGESNKGESNKGESNKV